MPKTVYNGDIKELMNETVNQTINALKKSGMYSDRKMTPYQKTEKVLYDYNDYLSAIKDKEEKIEDIKKYGLSKRAMSFIPMPSGSVSSGTRLEEEKENEAINRLEDSIKVTKRYIDIINHALLKLNDTPYNEIIDMYYFQEKSCEDIADYYKVDASTIRKHKKKLIQKLSIYLFSDEVISELYG